MRLEPVLEAFVVDSGYPVTEPDRDSSTWNRSDLQQIVRRTPEGYAFSSREWGEEHPPRRTTTSWTWPGC